MIHRLPALLGLLSCLLGALSLAPSHGAAGACERPAPRVGMLRPPAVIASDGGLLVRAAAALGGGDDASFQVFPDGRIALQQGHFVVGEREVDARVELLGAGIARVVPVEPMVGPALWVNAHDRVPLTFAEQGPTLTSAPELVQARLRVRRRRANGEDFDARYLLSVTLRRDPPSEARALLLFEGEAQQAVAYTELHGGGRRIEVANGGTCDSFGWPFSWPVAHAQVRVAYVDDSGRLSPLSRPARLR